MKAEQIAELTALGFKIIGEVAKVVRDASEGKVDHEAALDKLKGFDARLDAVNAAADAKLREKFGEG